MGYLARVIQGAVLLAAMGSSVVACSTVERSGTAHFEPIPVTEVGSVAGMWEGLLEQSAARRDDWVRLRIHRDGKYHFEAARTIGMFSGDGQLEVENGKLIAKGERGAVTFQLYRNPDDDARVLKGEGKGRDGLTYRTELTPVHSHR
ncbi:MAG: hypothetical protein AB7G68_09200 [Nitrospiraceae bacterium]